MKTKTANKTQVYIDRPLFMYYAATTGDNSIKAIAAKLKLSYPALAQRLGGISEFRHSEIKLYQDLYKVPAADLVRIFFSDTPLKGEEKEG